MKILELFAGTKSIGWAFESAEYETVYLVATRMNCIRKVSFEDMTYERV